MKIFVYFENLNLAQNVWSKGNEIWNDNEDKIIVAEKKSEAD